MARLLIRSGKDPFTPVVAESTLTQDVFNSNSGNFLFQHAVWKALAVDGSELVSNSTLSERTSPGPTDAERVNETFDHVVIPLANAFRPEFAPRLERLSDLLEDVTIPATVVGVGAQAAYGQGVETLPELDDVVRRFVGLVLDRSASIGVRGEFTQAYLEHLGFPSGSIDVIGCPSLFLNGRDHRVERRASSIDSDSRLALNLTPEVPGVGAFATAQAERHPNLTYIAQDANDLRLLLWGVPFPHVDDPAAPVHLHHPLYQQDRVRLFLDTWPWYDFLATQDFAYGTRFHGNVAALVAGTPAVLLAHDSRTSELAEYHRMPVLPMPELSADVKAEELYDAADLDAFNDATPEGFDRFTTFLERNGLEHRWQEGRSGAEFDARLAAATFPPPVHPLVAADGSEIASRLQWLRDGMVLDITRHAQAYEQPYPHPPWRGAGSRYARLHRQNRQHVKSLQQALDAQSRRVQKLEARLRQLEERSLRRRARRSLSRLRSWVTRR